MKAIAILFGLTFAVFANNVSTADDVIAKFVEHDNARRTSIGAYSVTCRYSLENKSRRAQMLVRWTRRSDGVKQYEVLSEQGDGAVRNHVFHRLLEAEVAASQPDEQERSRITPANYSFRLAGTEIINGRLAHVVELEPKTESKYLTRGRIWVDASEYAIVKIEGNPAHKVSFWTKNVNFVQTFEKKGDFWLAAANHSVTEARIFGIANLTIQYFDYDFVVAAAD